MAEQVNQLASSIANYNQAIVQASASGATPNDLLDARDQALVDLSELIGVTVVMEQRQRLHRVRPAAGHGQYGIHAYRRAEHYRSDASEPDAHQWIQLRRCHLSGVRGSISGLVRYREEVLDPTLNELGRLALVIADQVNSQLGQGIDLNGDFGTSRSAISQCACRIAEKFGPSGQQCGERQSFGIYRGFQQTQHQRLRSDLQQRYRLQRSRLSDGADLGSYDLSDDPAPVIDGFSLAMEAGTVAAGDKFTIIPTRTAAAASVS